MKGRFKVLSRRHFPAGGRIAFPEIAAAQACFDPPSFGRTDPGVIVVAAHLEIVLPLDQPYDDVADGSRPIAIHDDLGVRDVVLGSIERFMKCFHVRLRLLASLVIDRRVIVGLDLRREHLIEKLVAVGIDRQAIGIEGASDLPDVVQVLHHLLKIAAHIILRFCASGHCLTMVPTLHERTYGRHSHPEPVREQIIVSESILPLDRRTFLAGVGASGAGIAGTAHGAQSTVPGETSFGEAPDDKALRAAWKQFCRRLEEAGDRVFKAYNPPTPLLRADAFRFLTQNLGQAFALGYETKDSKFPVIHAFCTPFCKLGGDNADCIYQQAWIDGETVYKISGHRGTVSFLNFTVQGPRPEKQPGTDWPTLHEPFGDIPEANIFGHQLETQWDGSFELYIGGPKRGQNWLPTTPGSRKLFLRQGFDRWSELSARMRIER